MDHPDTTQEIIQRLQRDINCLSDENRATRKRGLERLRKETVVHSPPYTAGQLQDILNFLIKPLLKTFSDPVEKCRELAISLLAQFFSLVEDSCVFLPLLMPVAVSRLSNQEITETSEELRLSLVSLLTSVVHLCKEKMSPYLNDMVLILQRTIVDPYPQVKKESCDCATKLAQAIPATFHQQSESLAKSLFLSMTHQHSKVRLACIQALGSTVRYGSPNPLNDALPLLAQRACDNTPSIRSCLVDVVGNWLLELPDRYSYFPKLIPLLLTCMNDELPDIRRRSHDLWVKVGAQYEAENEEELKDKLNFMAHLTPSPLLEFGRPNLGCRILVYRNFSKILPALLRDMSDWTVNSRMKASLLLFSLLCHLEEHTTHHIQSVLTGLYRACQDNETGVIRQAARCSQVIGFYVPPAVWCRLVLPAVRTSAGCRVRGTDQASTVAVGPVQCTGCLHVLVCLMEGARAEVLQPHLKMIVECIYAPEISQSEHMPVLRELLDAAIVVIQTADNLCEEVSLDIFTIVLRVRASRHSTELNTSVERALLMLSNAQGHDRPRDLYTTHAKNVLEQIKDGYTKWSVHSPNCVVFSSLLAGAGPVLGELLEDVVPILTSCLRPDGDPEMRLHFISLLIRLLMDAPSSLDSQNRLTQFVSRVVVDIVIPNCVWRGGRTAAAIRTAAMTCMQALLQSKLLTREQLDTLMADLMPKVLSCLDDDNQSTRLVSCAVLRLLLTEHPHSINVEALHSLYSDLLKRLDDSNSEIRIATAQTLMSYVNAFPNEYDATLYKAHLEELYKGLLIHLDDPSPAIQEAILKVLQEAARLDKSLLRQQVEDVRHRHRNNRYCEQLLTLLTPLDLREEP